MPKRDLRWLIIIVVLLSLSLAAIFVPRINIGSFERGGDDDLGFSLGLDLVGGVHLLYQAKSDPDSPVLTKDDMEAVRRNIERRATAFGVAEPNIQIKGGDKILVELPGIKDVDRAIALMGGTAKLEFKKRECLNQLGDVSELFPEDACKDPKFHNDQDIGLTGDNLVAAFPGADSITGRPIVNIQFDSKGAEIFGKVTSEIAGSNNRVAVFLDDQELLAPVARSAIITGQAIIEGGDFTNQRVRDLSIQLTSGRLKVPLEIIERDDVDATLGRDSLEKSILAGYVGLLLVALFMIVYYRMAGVLAVMTLGIYGAIVLALFKLWPVTLTLAGVGGFIMSIGMAVDANVLIFERMKEELRAGRTLLSAIDTGFNRAWTSIRDSNVSTFIVCAILWWFGNKLGAPVVVSFAITLTIGVAVSMFSAIVITRTILRIVAMTRIGKAQGLFSPTGTISQQPTQPMREGN